MNYVGLFLLTAVIFIRPAEIFVALAGTQIYLVVIIIATCLSLIPILRQFSSQSLRSSPLTVCALGVLAAIACSNIANRYFNRIIFDTDVFGRIILVYLIVVGALTTPQRLEKYLLWIVFCTCCITVLCLIDYHGYYDFPMLITRLADGQIEGVDLVYRLQASGLFNNPNAFARILVTSLLISLYWLLKPSQFLFAPLWLGMMGLFGHAIVLTKSRGGLVGLVGGFAGLFVSRFGLKKAVILGCIGFPLLMAVAGRGRQTELSTSEGTGQHRIQLWSGGFDLFWRRPLFGIGFGEFAENFKYVAHNAFVHTYVELGFLGGMFFAGAYYLGITNMHRLQKYQEHIYPSELVRMRPFLMSIMAAEVMGMMSISSCYAPATYITWGLITSYLSVTQEITGIETQRFDRKTFKRLCVVGVIVVLGLYGFVKTNVRFGG